MLLIWLIFIVPISIFCCLLFRFFFLQVCSGAGFRDLSKLTSEEQRFHRRRLYTQNSAPQTASERQRHKSHLLPILAEIVFVLHSEGFGCISNYQKDTVLDPQGHGRDEKRCRCEEVPFHSINTLFIGCACLSEEQRYLYPRQNITDAG